MVSLSRYNDCPEGRDNREVNDIGFDFLEREMSLSADGYPMLSSSLGRVLNMLRSTLQRCLKHTVVPRQEDREEISGWLLSSA